MKTVLRNLLLVPCPCQIFIWSGTGTSGREGASLLADLAANVDVLVLAGDTTRADHLPTALTSLAHKYAEIVVVSGNHEFYSSDRRTEFGLRIWYRDISTDILTRRIS